MLDPTHAIPVPRELPGIEHTTWGLRLTFEFLLSHLPGVWCWIRRLLALSLSLPIRKIEIIPAQPDSQR